MFCAKLNGDNFMERNMSNQNEMSLKPWIGMVDFVKCKEGAGRSFYKVFEISIRSKLINGLFGVQSVWRE